MVLVIQFIIILPNLVITRPCIPLVVLDAGRVRDIISVENCMQAIDPDSLLFFLFDREEEEEEKYLLTSS